MKNMKYLKKAMSLLLAMMMVFSLSATALAAGQPQADNQIHVVFTQGCTYSYNDPDKPETYSYEWGTIAEPTGDEVVLDAGYVTLSNDLLNGRDEYAAGTSGSLLEKYFPAEPSILDVIYAAAVQTKGDGYITIGFDLNPIKSDPGAFVSEFNKLSTVMDTYETNEDGTVNMSGDGIVVAVQAPGAEPSDIYSSISFPAEYVSNVAAQAGTTIYVDYGHFEYYNVNVKS